jgi:hypothetical protein
MIWRNLKYDPPSGYEYCVLLFPLRTDVGVLYTVSNPQYAKVNALRDGYTHWAEFNLAPTHHYWQQWQEDLIKNETYK